MQFEISPIGANVYPTDLKNDKRLWKPKGDRIAIVVSLDAFLVLALLLTLFFEKRMICYLD